MADFRFARSSFYPDLDLDVSLKVVRSDAIQYTGRASVKARGGPGARQRWRDDFWKWADDRNLDAVAPRYGNRRIDGTSVYDCWLKDWQAVADFIVMWVGLDALSFALTDREAFEDRFGKKVQSLTKSMDAMTHTIDKMEKLYQRQDETWQRFRAFLVDANASSDSGGNCPTALRAR